MGDSSASLVDSMVEVEDASTLLLALAMLLTGGGVLP